MAIFKAKVESNYAVLPNSTLQDSSISYEATGLLAMILSLPDDWEIHKTWLQKQKIKCGRDKMSKMMNELVDAGYVVVKQSVGEDGRFLQNDYLVHPTPVNLKSVDGKTVDGKTVTTKETDIQSKQDTNINVPTASVRKSDYPKEFEWLWARKPNREGGNPKKQAYSACKARLKDGSTWNEMANGLIRYHKYCQAKGLINTPMVQQMATFFGTKESFKETWSYDETNQPAVNATGNRRLTAEEERNQELLRKYGHTTAPTKRTVNTDEHSGLDQRQVQRGIPEQVEQEGVTIDLDSGDWSSYGQSDSQGC